MEEYLKEADVPLVGCFANDTENRFTAGIDNNSEEIKQKFTSVTLSHTLGFIMFQQFTVLFLRWTQQWKDEIRPESELSDPVHEGTLTRTSVCDIGCLKMSDMRQRWREHLLMGWISTFN